MFKGGRVEHPTMVASDWTERHRPMSERQLEGNEGSEERKSAFG
jgi:hypothetical protein